MRQEAQNIKLLSDGDLAKTLHRMAGDLRSAEAAMLLYLSEMQERRLYAKAGYSSLFAYCVGELKFSEGTTCRRLAAARTVARFPEVLALVTSGELHVTALAMLEKHLTEANVAELTRRAVGCSKTQLEWLIAEVAPKADGPDCVRKAPVCDKIVGKNSNDQAIPFTPDIFAAGDGGAARQAPQSNPKARSNSTVQPIAPHRVLIKCSASSEVAAKIKRAKELLAHKHPGGALESILEAALDALLEKIDPERKEARKEHRRAKSTAKKPSPTPAATPPPAVPPPPAGTTNSRYVPAAVKAEALRESGGQCTYLSPDGRRCMERGALQFDHVQPHALGGASTLENIRVYCRCHNAYAARQTFGSHEPWRGKAL